MLPVDGGHFRIVKSLISKGADINLYDSEDKSPLYLACVGEIAEVVQYLLTHGAKINACSPLNMMCEFGSF